VNKLPTLAPQTMAEAMEFSKMISHSQMVPKQYQGKPQDVLVAIQWGYELGLQPLQPYKISRSSMESPACMEMLRWPWSRTTRAAGV
jgi:hypothetical protein